MTRNSDYADDKRPKSQYGWNRRRFLANATGAASAASFASLGGDAAANPSPLPTLNPPLGIKPAQTRSPHYHAAKQIPPRRETPQQRSAYETRANWFHQAKYGLAFHFLAGMTEHKIRAKWTSEKWNAWVDSIDVEKAADQAREIGAGYVMLTIGQNCQYYCAPNPVIEKHWQLEPGQYASRRDLPADLYKALKKRSIRLMLYMAADNQYRLPRPADLAGMARFDRWVEVNRWYSDHYGDRCSGWWIDGLYENIGPKDYTELMHSALRHGNPDALLASGTYGLSDFTHGHADMRSWARQQKMMLPYFGRWDAEYQIQWQVFQYLGRTWGGSTLGHRPSEMLDYATKVVRGGGVITFDVGVFRDDRAAPGPFLDIPEVQMDQLRAIQDALKDIPASDGKE